VTRPLQVASARYRVQRREVVIDRECSRLADPADEYVRTNADTADLGAWLVRNVLGRTFNFPPGRKLAAGQTVKVPARGGYRDRPALGLSRQPAWETGDKLTLHNQEDVDIRVEPTKHSGGCQ
jgi:hypothetical protein